MAIDIANTVANIDTQFAFIVSKLLSNKYNPERLYDTNARRKRGKDDPQPNQDFLPASDSQNVWKQKQDLTRQNFDSSQLAPTRHSDIAPNQDFLPASDSQNVWKQKGKLTDDKLSTRPSRTQVKNDPTPNQDFLPASDSQNVWKQKGKLTDDKLDTNIIAPVISVDQLPNQDFLPASDSQNVWKQKGKLTDDKFDSENPLTVRHEDPSANKDFISEPKHSDPIANKDFIPASDGQNVWKQKQQLTDDKFSTQSINTGLDNRRRQRQQLRDDNFFAQPVDSFSDSNSFARNRVNQGGRISNQIKAGSTVVSKIRDSITTMPPADSRSIYRSTNDAAKGQPKQVGAVADGDLGYMRMIRTDVLAKLDSQARQSYRKMFGTNGNWGLAGRDLTPYKPRGAGGRLNVYDPIKLQLTPDMLLKLTSAMKDSKGFVQSMQRLGGGLRQYYFGYLARIGRLVNMPKRTAQYGYLNRLIGFMAYNTLAGTLMNMVPTPRSFTLGFDVPMVGLLSINQLGVAGKGGPKSQYRSPNQGGDGSPAPDGVDNPRTTPDSIHGNLHPISTFTDLNKRSNLRALQGQLLGVSMSTNSGFDRFYSRANLIRQNGQTTNWKKRTPYLAGGYDKILLSLLKKLNKPSLKDPSSTGSLNRYYKSSKEDKSNTYRNEFDMFQNFFESQRCIKIIIQSDKNKQDIIFPASITNISNDVTQSWQDTWNNTGRYQPIKSYVGTSMAMRIGFTIMASSHTASLDLFNGNSSSSARIQAVHNRYIDRINKLTQLRYPSVVDPNSFKRYNVETKLTIGNYLNRRPVFITSVGIKPNRQYYWNFGFPMVLDVSMSVVVFGNDSGASPKFGINSKDKPYGIASFDSKLYYDKMVGKK